MDPATGLGVSRSYIRDVLARFEQTGDVATHQGQGADPLARRALTRLECQQIVSQLVRAPRVTLKEQRALFILDSGVVISYGAFCRAVKTLGYMRKIVCAVAYQADMDKAEAWLREVLTFHSAIRPTSSACSTRPLRTSTPPTVALATRFAAPTARHRRPFHTVETIAHHALPPQRATHPAARPPHPVCATLPCPGSSITCARRSAIAAVFFSTTLLCPPRRESATPKALPVQPWCARGTLEHYQHC